ncbi:(3R)-hydroxyacyl-ACP dehydratase subunit HadA [Lolliginicoccus lacisalsi]|uniref:(3R)-hydroxyacyl-ACP dehydratase subunit HadA n=1 Tax=Lolliginicoccus lacisalsi TaxID=2742202 RepID=UPI002FD70950
MSRVAFTADSVGAKYRMANFYEVGREKIREFAAAVQDDHPAHFSEDAARELGYDALVAPVTFASVLGVITTLEMFEHFGWSSDLRNIMQTDQRFVFHRPIVAGDRLRGETCIDSFRHMAGNDVIVTANHLLDDKDEIVQTTYTTLIRREDLVAGGEQ